MAETCTHVGTLADVTPSGDGCEEDCLRIGSQTASGSSAGAWVASGGTPVRRPLAWPSPPP